ncbi:hypothetical protein [uncultured Microbacterium sp.]|uniref:hypothetical protein n=1 Tax=uncultured Microbacterium sp. TaxID=191216 RepID=UPI0025D86ABF|nr:hypothetical protein [uncultured Microbacterium sp.]
MDEADRLKTATLERVHEFDDRHRIGVVLIGMPGIDNASPAIPSCVAASARLGGDRDIRVDEKRHLRPHCCLLRRCYW